MNLKEFRRIKKLKQKDIAEQIGVSASYYSKVEKGYRSPSYEFLNKLKNTYPEISVDEMFFNRTKHQ